MHETVQFDGPILTLKISKQKIKTMSAIETIYIFR